MKYLKLAYIAFVDRLGSNIALICQLIIMFALVNLMIASINSRTMLTDSYSEFIDKQGWYIGYYRAFLPGEDGKNDINKSEYDPEYGIDNLIDTFEIKPEVLKVKMAPVRLKSGEYGEITILPDIIYDDLKIPVYGYKNYFGNKLLLFPNKTNLKLRDSFSFTTTSGRKVDTESTGILTDPTYIPRFTSWHIDGDISMLYNKVSGNTDSKVYMITDQSTADNWGITKDDVGFSVCAIVYYSNPIDNAKLLEMENVLKDNINVSYTPISVLKEKADESLSEDVNKYTPLGIVMIIIVMIGTAGSVAIQTLDELKKYVIYYLCGIKWNRIILISFFRIIVLLLVSALICGTVFINVQSTSIASRFGLYFNETNLYISLALIGLIILSSLILPFILIKRSEPADLMRRIKND
ncbi:hypothetical protein SAMN02910317_02797 [Ruminococcaceae bacterium FB2012]|nr:hypothetical protein SAMN02910317_02797 [Ruminococcaceae bacterium FB2012]